MSTPESAFAQASAEIKALQESVASLDKKLSQLLSTNLRAHETQNSQPQTAFDVLTGSSMPKSRSTAALDRLNAQSISNCEEVAMATTRVVMHQIVLPSDTDALGICFGGQVLGWIDVCAGLAAKTVARGPCVTASVDAVHFLRPCRVGSVAIIAAMVNRTFQSSLEVGVRVEEEDMLTGARHHCCSAYLTFVSVMARPGPGRAAKPLPKIVPGTQHQREIFRAAELRRQERLVQTLSGEKHGVSPDFTLAHMTQLIMPQHANSLGITFGGQVMRWMEQCAYIAASRVGRGGHLLTGSMDSIIFTQPTRVGDVMYITAQVTGIFTSSAEVMISVCGESPTEREVFYCGDAFATVVSVNRTGGTVDIPFTLEPETGAEKQRCAGAEVRRQERLEMRRSLMAQQAKRPSLDGSMQIHSISAV
ncbi:MAG: Acyl-coenzyme A thioesterase 11 [Trebouxia sp. A1-2]|nr:MAG: Acyl-coenzyme A thioesterase 11 [Trebouxia sp. A1-2]KAA6420616.1 MAG: Acyl-coenzyme A thioesterase 11 [Trebouxia sp. A1-2]